MKQLYFLLFLFVSGYIYGQPPVINYNTPQVYNVGTTISPLVPNNSGGNVPTGTYDLTSTFSGITHPAFANGTISTASYYQPRDVTVDLSGNTYIIDDNNVIRKVSPTGIVTTFAGSGALGSTNGTGTSATFRNMLGIITDAAGNVYVTDSNNNMIRKVTPAGVVTTLAGSGNKGSANGTGVTASFNTPYGIGIDVAGNLYVADMFNNMIRKITPAGVVNTVAGNGSYGSADGPSTSATFSQPEDVTVDAAGNIYVVDAGNNKIRKINTTGVVTTLAGSGQQGHVDGTGAAASFYFPTAITINTAGDLFVCDAFNQTIRKVTQTGVVTTIAGSPNGSYGYADGIGRAARFSYPYGIGTDGSNLFIADNQNSDIRKISLSGYTISPNLPAGLIFDQTTGIISGTPSTKSPATNYTVTAYNAYGNSTTIVNIEVTALTAQIITFLPPAVKTYGDADFNTGTTSSNATLPLSYTSSNVTVATVTTTGNIHIVGAGNCVITVSQNGNSNYAPAKQVAQTITVKPAVLTITADNKSKNYGAVNPAFTFSYSGFVLNENTTVLMQLPLANSNATALSAVGSYSITLSGALAANYTFVYNQGVLTINKANLTITADSKTRQYGQANPPLTLTYNGFANGETVANLDVHPNIITIANISSSPGSYNITVNNAQSSNYQINFVAGILTITKASQTINFAPFGFKHIGDPSFLLTAIASSGLTVTFSTSNQATAAVTNTNQITMYKSGKVIITATQPGDNNYEAATAQQELIVSPLGINIPNTFTPNSDGVNDKWEITGLELYNTIKVQIYNRFGALVFESFGNYTPWDGLYHDKPLPVGVYYYIISVKNNAPKLSGSVAIIY